MHWDIQQRLASYRGYIDNFVCAEYRNSSVVLTNNNCTPQIYCVSEETNPGRDLKQPLISSRGWTNTETPHELQNSIYLQSFPTPTQTVAHHCTIVYYQQRTAVKKKRRTVILLSGYAPKRSKYYFVTILHCSYFPPPALLSPPPHLSRR